MDNQITQLKETINTLKGAREVIGIHNSWTKGTFARDNKGACANPLEDNACRFCTMGAVYKAGGYDTDSYHVVPFHVFSALEYLNEVMCHPHEWEDIVEVNDDHKTKHKHVLMAFDFAILQAEDELKALKKKVKK